MGRILIIEDELDIAEMYRWILELDGHDVLAIEADPRPVIDTVLTPHPDIIVLDERVSGLSGTAFLPQLRSIYPLARVIVATADPIIVADKNRLGVEAAMLKPFSLERLSRNVQHLLIP